MKKAVLGLTILAALGVAAVAQAQAKLRVGVIDTRKILVESKSGQQSRAELEKMVKERREKLGKEEAAIKALHEKLEKDKLVLNDGQKAQKQKEIEDRVGALKKMSQDAQQEVGKRDSELSSKAGTLLKEIVDGIAKQEKLAMVIDKNQSGVLWVEEQVDITDKALKAYEAKLGK
ncbi:MAG TPA: OmpH family outer membrane protein [Burkholderiales bacterium]|nr:OmpH family outer membrane protein [Burkholderiales bacterium]